MFLALSSVTFLLLIKGLRFRTTKRTAWIVKSTAKNCLSKKNCLPFNENFPAEKAYRLLESILATKYSRHKLFVDRTREWFPAQNAFFVILSHTILTINQRRLAFEFCLLFQNNMRGKFTRGNLQEFQHQVSSHSETEQITRASSSSSILMEEMREV